MVNLLPDQMDSAFAALGHAIRRAILARLLRGPTSVAELAASFPISLPAISKHLAVLEEAQLLRRVKHGRTRVCYLRPEPLHAAAGWLEPYGPFWEA